MIVQFFSGRSQAHETIIFRQKFNDFSYIVDTAEFWRPATVVSPFLKSDGINLLPLKESK